MLYVAFLFRPWIIMMREFQANPRVLADDIMLFTRGAQHEQQFKAAFDATHEYIEDLGAQLAPEKSTTFSTNRVTRKKLRTHIWSKTGTKIKVIQNARDLGSHLSTTSVMSGSTLTDRINSAIETVNRIRFTPFSYKTKAHLIRAAGIPNAPHRAIVDSAVAQPSFVYRAIQPHLPVELARHTPCVIS